MLDDVCDCVVAVFQRSAQIAMRDPVEEIEVLFPDRLIQMIASGQILFDLLRGWFAFGVKGPTRSYPHQAESQKTDHQYERDQKKDSF